MTLKEYTDRLAALRSGDFSKLLISKQYAERLIEQPLCTINLPTGKIVANDPICFYQKEPFEKKVKPGKYPIVLYIHCIDNDKRVSFAEIRFSSNIPVKFELAVHAGEALTELADNEYYGYGVDSGTGGFCDKKTCDKYEEFDKTPPEIEDMLSESYVDTYSTADYHLPNTDLNIAVFSAGFGDGCYPSYWGFDKDGNICSLITDFLTLDEAE